jgi:hypothetical protein
MRMTYTFNENLISINSMGKTWFSDLEYQNSYYILLIPVISLYWKDNSVTILVTIDGVWIGNQIY